MIDGKQEALQDPATATPTDPFIISRALSTGSLHICRALVAQHRGRRLAAPPILATGSCCSCAILRRYGAVSQQQQLYILIRTQVSPFVIQSLRESRVIFGVSHVLSARGAAWTPRYASIMFASYHSSYLVTIIFLIEIPSRKYLVI